MLGIGVERFWAVVAEHRDDDGVLAGLRALGIPNAQNAWFDAPAFEAELTA